MSKPLIGVTCHYLRGNLPQSSTVQVYLESILVAGGAPLAIPIGLDKESLRTVYDVLDGVLLPGGDDVGPERYGQQRHPLLG
ncbi:MAG: gamma-glutamyl-gamma-aminobutyrate hydrolase family protein, partial [Chloroflexota bacterium]